MTEMECPAGACGYSITHKDPDAMMGHLLTKHGWHFDTANQWFRENWPEVLP